MGRVEERELASRATIWPSSSGARATCDEARRLLEACGEAPDYAPFYAARSLAFEDASRERSMADLERAARLDPAQWRYGRMLAERQLRQGAMARGPRDGAAPTPRGSPTTTSSACSTPRRCSRTAATGRPRRSSPGLNVMPYEGSIEGRRLYREAHLMLAVEALKKGDATSARREIDAARLWPENLGAGQALPRGRRRAARGLPRRAGPRAQRPQRAVEGAARSRSPPSRGASAGRLDPRARPGPEADGPRGRGAAARSPTWSARQPESALAAWAAAPTTARWARCRRAPARTRGCWRRGWHPRDPSGGGRMSPRRPFLLALALGLVAAAAEARVVGITIERREPVLGGQAVRPRRPLRDAGRHRRVRPRPFAAAEPGRSSISTSPRGTSGARSCSPPTSHPEARGRAPRQRARVLRGPQPRRQGHPAAAAVRRGLDSTRASPRTSATPGSWSRASRSPGWAGSGTSRSGPASCACGRRSRRAAAGRSRGSCGRWSSSARGRTRRRSATRATWRTPRPIPTAATAASTSGTTASIRRGCCRGRAGASSGRRRSRSTGASSRGASTRSSTAAATRASPAAASPPRATSSASSRARPERRTRWRASRSPWATASRRAVASCGTSSTRASTRTSRGGASSTASSSRWPGPGKAPSTTASRRPRATATSTGTSTTRPTSSPSPTGPRRTPRPARRPGSSSVRSRAGRRRSSSTW